VRKYAQEKVITSWKLGKKIYVSRSECIELLNAGVRVNQGIVNWRTILKLQTDVEKLKSQVQLLNKINDLHRDPLSLSDQELAILYESCMDMLTLSAFKLEDIETWSDIFLRLEDKAMRVMRDKIHDPNPAIHFYRLVKRMTNSVEKLANYDTNIQLQMLGAQLKKGLSNCSMLVAIGLSDEVATNHSDRIRAMMGSKENEIGQLVQFLRPKRHQ